jgi:squalene synthase HpnC
MIRDWQSLTLCSMSVIASESSQQPVGRGRAPANLDPRTPPIELLRTIGPDGEREVDVPAITAEQAIAYCRGLATTHYENFSVLSALVPERLRDDFAAVYAFCRWADDLGDETGQSAEARARSERLLGWWRVGLDECFGDGGAPSHPVYIALRATAQRHKHLTTKPFHDLIDAFVQDQRVGIASDPATHYKTWDQVLDYCTRSANPVGRIVLTLGGYAPPEVDPSNSDRYAMSDATCTALQLINFWQDVRRDLLERDRVYVPVMGPGGAATGITPELLKDWVHRSDDPRARVPFIRGLRPLVDETASLFRRGKPLPDSLDPGLRPVVWLFGAGGEAILAAVRRIGCATLWDRPKLSAPEKLLLVARAWLGARRGSRARVG